MSKSKHTEAQIIAVLKQVEAGRAVEDVARECGVPKHTIHAWKSKSQATAALLQTLNSQINKPPGPQEHL